MITGYASQYREGSRTSRAPIWQTSASSTWLGWLSVRRTWADCIAAWSGRRELVAQDSRPPVGDPTAVGDEEIVHPPLRVRYQGPHGCLSRSRPGDDMTVVGRSTSSAPSRPDGYGTWCGQPSRGSGARIGGPRQPEISSGVGRDSRAGSELMADTLKSSNARNDEKKSKKKKKDEASAPQTRARLTAG